MLICSFVLSSLRARWRLNVLAVMLGALATAAAVAAVLLGAHAAQRFKADAAGIDLVVGAKGSPLQLVLSSIYHLDVPTGNIPLSAAQNLMHDKSVRTAIPLALGDSWRTARIVGTTPAYAAHYGAEIAQGRFWNAPFEAVAGALVPLDVGVEFTGSHGLAPGGHAHAETPYRVVGRLSPTGTVIDRLILTSTDSVIAIHAPHHHAHEDAEGAHGHDEHDHDHAAHAHEQTDATGHDEDQTQTAASGHAQGDRHDQGPAAEANHTPEITALLLTLRAPTAVMTLPRLINRDTNLQAASPALEMARLGKVFGFGRRAVMAVAALFAAMTAAAIFAGLAAGLEQRAGDIAILRALGYGPGFVFATLAAEGAILALLGALTGLWLGVASVVAAGAYLPPPAPDVLALFTQSWPVMTATCGGVFLCGLAASLLPALRGAKMDITAQLMRD